MSEDRAAELQRLWTSLAKLFPGWSLSFDWFFSASSYHMLGADLIKAQLHDPRVRKAAKLLAGLPEDNVHSLAAMARLNEERAATLARAVAVCYITLPIGLAALLSDAAPDALRALVATNLSVIAPLIFAAILTPLTYFNASWRAKQIVWAIDLYRAGGVAPARGR